MPPACPQPRHEAPSLTGEGVDAAGEFVAFQAVQPGLVLECAAQHLTVMVIPRRFVPLQLPSWGRQRCCCRCWLGGSWERPHSYFKGQKNLTAVFLKVFKLLIKQLPPRNHSVDGDPPGKSFQPQLNSHAAGLSSSEVISESISFSFTFSVLSLKSLTSSWSRVLMTALLRLVAEPMRSGSLWGDQQVFQEGRKAPGQVHGITETWKGLG